MDTDTRKIVLGIPTLNRADLLKESLEDIAEKLNDLHHYIIIDNGNQKINIPAAIKDKTTIIRPESNVGVAASWNMILDESFYKHGATEVLILNDDIVLGYTETRLNNVLNKCPGYYLIVGGYYWSSFFISREGYEKVGKFDEKFFPAYFEDNDYNRRLALINGDGVKRSFYINTFAPKVKRNSMTIKKSPQLNKNFDKNKKYYIEKWGGEPRKEKFTKPFNNMKKTSIDDIKKLWGVLGTNKVGGSSIHTGKSYHDVPFKELSLPVHRRNIQMRIDLIKKHYDVNGKYGLDLGCSVGGLAFGACLNGAKSVVGVDYDKQSIDVANAIEDYYHTGAKFMYKNINLESIDEIIEKAKNPKTGRVDFVLWFSQFMWLVKQHDLDHASELLLKLSNCADVMFFETSQGEAAAGDAMRKYDITSGSAVKQYLKKYVPYQSINNLGDVKDGWASRDIFFMSKPLDSFNYDSMIKQLQYKKILSGLPIARGVTSTVYIDKKNNRVIKVCKKDYVDPCWKNETTALERLAALPESLSRHFPKLLYKGEDVLELSYCGQHLSKKSMPEDNTKQIKEIIDALKQVDLVHRDIKPDNVLIHADIIKIIDFGWVSNMAEKENVHKKGVGLGGKWKNVKGFDDGYSLRKSIKEIKES
jgi:hypothetical protein